MSRAVMATWTDADKHDQPESPEEPDVDWEVAADTMEKKRMQGLSSRIRLPFESEDITELQSVFQQIDPNTPVKELLLCREYVAERVALRNTAPLNDTDE
ncbi:hypothetical protein F7725_024562, partial [Dissostichus mawsoni]